MTAGVNDTERNICYSLPRLITMGIQCSFCAYFWELYTGEFGWTHAEYGAVSSLYSFTQIFAFFGLGAIFTAIERRVGETKNKLEWSKWILICGTILHWVSFVLLIILPIGWYGVKLTVWRKIDKIFWSAKDVIHRWVPANAERYLPPSKMGPILADSIPDPPVDFGLLEQIRVSISDTGVMSDHVCCYCRIKDALFRFVKTKAFLIYILTVIHGVSQSAHELSNAAIKTYIYNNQSEMDAAGNLNLTFFFISNIVIYFIFSFVKLLIRSKTAFSDTFVALSIMFMLIQAPILWLFYTETTWKDAVASKGIDNPNVYLCFKFFSATTLHATTLFWMFSGGPLTVYISVFVLGGHTGIMSFGLLIINIGLTGMSFILMGITSFGVNKIIIAVTLFVKDEIKRIITGACVLCQFFTFMLFYRFDYWWNKGSLVSCILLIVTGVVNSFGATYANVLLNFLVKDARARDWTWLFYGAFFSGSNIVVFPSMLIMFRSFGQNRQAEFRVSCIQIILDYCFPGVYKSMTLLFIIANLIAHLVYWTCHYLDWDSAVLARFGDCAELKAKAAAFAGLDTSATDAQKVQAFKAAASALNSTASDLKKFGCLIYYISRKPGCGGLSSVYIALRDASNSFKTACGPGSAGNHTRFKGIARVLGNNNAGFNTAANYFHRANVWFEDAKTHFNSTNKCDKTLITAADKFKNAAVLFANAATAFNRQVQSSAVTPDNLTTTIVDHFKDAVEKVSHGTKHLYLALKDIPLLS